MATHTLIYQGLEIRSLTPIDDGMVAAFCDIEHAINMAAANNAVIDYIALMGKCTVVSLRRDRLPMILPVSEALELERQLYFGTEEKEATA